MKFNLEKIVGSEEKFSLQHRILNASILLGAILSVFALISNIIIGLFWITNLLVLLGIILFFSLYFFSLKTGKSNFVAIFGFGFLVLIFSPMMWFANSGTMGGFQYYILFFIVGIYISTSGKIKWTLLILMILVTLSLIIIEYLYPDLIIHYNNKQERYIDLVISFFTAIVGIIIYAGIYFRQYESTNKKLEIKNKMLEKSRQEIFEHKGKIELQKKEIEIKAKSLEDLNKTKDQLFSIISHDLKSPFNSLLGFTELLQSEGDGMSKDEILRITNIIHKSSEQGYNLVLQLLEWYKSQTNQVKFKQQKLNLIKLVNENIELVKTQAKNKNIDIVFIKEQEACYTYADKNMINTVLRNLISNALKYTENGKIEINCNYKHSNCQLSISDTGIGISQEKLKNIFYFDDNISVPGTAGERGTGLGLILCKDFIERNNGRISVESTINKGSVFCFNLPLYRYEVE
jgi:signal transduction histidine kinase